MNADSAFDLRPSESEDKRSAARSTNVRRVSDTLHRHESTSPERGQILTLHAFDFDPSPVPLVDQERIRLLLAIKAAPDFYELHFAIAEHCGYVRGLFMACQISAPSLVAFQFEARRVAQVSADRLAVVTQ